ncbi:MAG: ABC transporter substrate-binding protein [Candidatus Thiodiazotropha sp. (ex Lucinoma aequizonata)]|nr:ABC transporter substrate-binding protein [Candidatus Thiodiazotropha sp. (ex Lucinoma aequizonata)]MCU7913641.1 ABC transporter substrate-binding protein [Candidatus Thiodiazotropha sp. (ex Lucinoma aequizonata)]
MVTALLLLLLTALPVMADPPQRVVSVNLCSDQLLLLLADPQQVASVSYLSREQESSFVVELAVGFPVNHAQIEEVISYRPDLVVTTPYTNPRLLNTLEKLGFKTHSLTLGHSAGAIATDIRQLAARLGQIPRGEALIMQMQQRLQLSRSSSLLDRPKALFYQPRGYTSGIDTLQNEALQLAGWRNPAAEQGIVGYVPIPLEQIILWQPDTLFTSNYGESGDSLAERQLEHPALKRLLGHQSMLQIPYKYWICPGPMLADAVSMLYEARERER